MNGASDVTKEFFSFPVAAAHRTRPRFVPVAVGIAAASVVLSGCSLFSDGSLRAGDCTGPLELGSDVGFPAQVSCEEEHHGEVFHAFTLEGIDTYDVARIEDAVFFACDAAFEEYVGLPWDQSAWGDYVFYGPNEDGFSGGEREFVCIAEDPEGAKVGSIAGSAE